MTGWTLEDEIERAWELLTCTEPSRCYGAYPVRHYFLTESNHLVYGQAAERVSHKLAEVGYYTHAVTLADFRADVFHAHNEGQAIKKARTLGR